MRTLLILRTHRADPDTLAAFDRYAGLRSADAVICCDERHGAVDAGGRAKLGFDDGTLVSLGLFPHPGCGWRCGDYAYYVTRAAMPDYDFYWLIEPDVVLHTANLDATFAALNASKADFLAAHFGPRDHQWRWYKTMHQTTPDVYGCIFPITRLSASAIDHLHEARRSLGSPQTRYAMNHWPNDEAFVANELHHHGFHCHELGHGHPGCYTHDTLRTAAAWDRTALGEQPPDGRIYHPVRHFPAWFEQQSAWAEHYALSRRGDMLAPLPHDQIRLVRLARASLGTSELHQAALFPLLVASRMRLDASGEAETAESYAHVEEKNCTDRAMHLLHRWFVPNPDKRAFATAQLVSPAADEPGDIATTFDFLIDGAEPLRAPPVPFALAYACNFEDASLLFTVHPLPQKILSADNIHAQRDHACVGCSVPLRHLSRFYPAPSEMPDVSFLVLGDLSALAEQVRQLRATGRYVVADPPALMQLARQSGRFFTVRRPWRSSLLWATVAPVFVTYGASAGPAVFVVSEEILALRGVLEALFGDVTFAGQIDDVP